MFVLVMRTQAIEAIREYVFGMPAELHKSSIQDIRRNQIFDLKCAKKGGAIEGLSFAVLFSRRRP